MEARQWAQEMIDFAKKIQPQGATEAFVERFGNVNTIYFFGQFESLAEMDKLTTETMSDEGWLVLMTKSADLFVDGSQSVILMESL
ncbi:MAG: hypothetical protein JRG97_15370 [Deltaproteobacteria bacterium]|nr:hypothetical protein [Deltaproteobacteria bacterium]MBW2053554.1 hypothetical protein [Deltaproteobacteria bacterium]MBW2142413.1 hypothetical protein [Deltaproteobacteria bacterium]MBW2324357.1 hypothetical protein [Deltaproteobacteria bacterium]